MIALIVLFLFIYSHIVVNDAFKIQPRIVGGYSASSGQFAYYGFLEIKHQEPNKTMACGCALISDEWIIAAAHCLQEKESLVVHLGKTVLNKVEDGHVFVSVKKKDFFIHPNYRSESVLNDIGRFSRIDFNFFLSKYLFRLLFKQL